MNRYSSVVQHLARQKATNKISDIVSGAAYNNYGANPDKDGVMWISLCLSTDGAPLRNQVVFYLQTSLIRYIPNQYPPTN